MKLAGPFALGTFSVPSAPGQAAFPGLLAGGQVRDLAADDEFAVFAGGGPLTTRSLLEHWDEALPRLLSAARSGKDSGWIPVDWLRTHAPVQPRQIFQSGANYRAHVIDLAVAHEPADGRPADQMFVCSSAPRSGPNYTQSLGCGCQQAGMTEMPGIFPDRRSRVMLE